MIRSGAVHSPAPSAFVCAPGVQNRRAFAIEPQRNYGDSTARLPSDFYAANNPTAKVAPCRICMSHAHTDSEHFARALLVSRLWPGLAPVDVLGTSVWNSLRRHNFCVVPNYCTEQVPLALQQSPCSAAPRERGVKRRVSAESCSAGAALLAFATKRSCVQTVPNVD
jgi:hypothetical protein